MIEYESLTYKNSKGSEIVFGVGSAYFVNVQKDVAGISDLNNVIYSSSSMNQNGNTFVGSRIEPREIEIDGKILIDDKSEQLALRRAALKILNPELEGTLTYRYAGYTRTIGAKVTKSPRFTHPNAYQKFSIVFECLDPFWKESYDTTETLASWIGAWSFPCEIDQNNPEDMIFAYQRSSLITTIVNRGDVATGMIISFKALGTVVNPYLYCIETQEQMKINYSMQLNDVIIVDGSYGEKTITLKRAGQETSLFRYMDPDSIFLQLDVGTSTYRYGAGDGEENMEVEIRYAPKYLGV